MSEVLITVPMFTFKQGDIFDGGELPIQVLYWNGGDVIELSQEDNSVLLRTQDLKRLFRAIEKHLPEAKSKLSKKEAK